MKPFAEMNRQQLQAAAGESLAVLPIGAHFRGQRPRAERHGFWRDIDGFTDSPDRTANGALFRQAVVRGLTRAFLEFCRDIRM